MAGSVASSNTAQAAGQMEDLTAAAACSQPPPSRQVPLSPGLAVPSLNSRRPSQPRPHSPRTGQLVRQVSCTQQTALHRTADLVRSSSQFQEAVAQSSPTAGSLQPSTTSLAVAGMFSVSQVNCSYLRAAGVMKISKRLGLSEPPLSLPKKSKDHPLHSCSWAPG